MRLLVFWLQFHSGLWPNLHHFLYQQARLRHRTPGPALAGVLADTASLSEGERRTWERVVAYYDTAVAPRPIDSDSPLIDVNYALADDDLAKIPKPLAEALTAAEPIYRKYFWPRHDSANRAWIAAMQAEVTLHGEALVAALKRVYHVPLPETPIRVEVVAYANWAGAYTTIHPTLITISSTNPDHRGSLGLEQLVHETSHAMMDSVEAELGPRVDRRNVGHTIIFFTAGELVRHEIPTHTPYAEARGLWASPGSPLTKLYPIVVPIWREYLDGKRAFHDALRAIAAATAAAS